MHFFTLWPIKERKGWEQGLGRDSTGKLLKGFTIKDEYSNPVGKAKSIAMTAEAFLKSEELFERYFTKEIKTIPLPKFTDAAKKRWNQVPERVRKDIMDTVWCTRCRIGTPMQLMEETMSGRSLILRGTCKQCGGEVVRVIEPAEE